VSAEVLDAIERRARSLLERTDRRSLGPVRAEEAARFARACGEDDPTLIDSDHPHFRVHPLFVVSRLRGGAGSDGGDTRPDGMYADEVPGASDAPARLMAGGQEITWHHDATPDRTVHYDRTLVSVQRKNGRSGAFLILTVHKSYGDDLGRTLAEVSERFLVR
jgi:N-terminal half of MaoC dehydratase